MSKFEQQKEDIIDVLNEINASCEPIQYGQYSWLFDKITELQPTRPTCATCEHLTQFQHKHKKSGRCDVFSRSFLGVTELAVNVGDINNFGCINHSDYEKGQTNG